MTKLICGLGCALLLAFAASDARGQEPPPTPIGGGMDWSVDAAGVSWTAVPGAVEYEVEYAADAWRVNAVDPCLPPSRSGVVGLSGVDGRWPATDGTHIPFDLEDPSPDAWLLTNVRVDIRANDANGAVIAMDGGASFSDPFCANPRSLSPPLVAPSAGQGTPLDGALSSVAALLGVAILALGGAFMVARRW